MAEKKHEKVVPVENSQQPVVKIMGQNLTEKDFQGFQRPPVKIVSNRSKPEEKSNDET